MDINTFNMMARLAPDLMDKIVARALVLERLSIMQPAGRRALSQKLGMQEREARVLTDILRQDGLIRATSAGMVLTDKAYEMLDNVRELVRTRTGLASLETQLQILLRIEKVFIVPGNADRDSEVLDEVGRIAGARLRKVLSPGMILAVNGGTTVQAVAKHMTRGVDMDVTVLPARGGLGTSAGTQANTLAEQIAFRLGGRHKPLYLPDNLPQNALAQLMELDEIREPLEELKKADVLLYGISRADDMASSRVMSRDETEKLLSEGAAAEVLGHCFDIEGRHIASASGIGISEESFFGIPVIMAVAAGTRKAEAILAACRHHRHSCLVTDEAAATRILSLIRD